MGAVLQETNADDGGWMLELEIEERDFLQFAKREKLPTEILKRKLEDKSAVSVV